MGLNSQFREIGGSRNFAGRVDGWELSEDSRI